MATTSRPRGLRVRTRCATEAEFLAEHHRDAEASSMFIASERPLSPGTDVAFSLELADGKPMVRGLGVVTARFPTSENRYRRVGVSVSFVQLTTTSEVLHCRMLAARAEVPSRPRRDKPITNPLWGGVVSPTMEMEVPSIEDDEIIGDVRKSITREMQAAPIAHLVTTDTSRYEGPLRAPALPAPIYIGDMEGMELFADAESRPAPWWRNQRVASVFVGGLLVGCLFSLIVGSSPDLPRSPARTATAVAASSLAPETVQCDNTPPLVAAVEPAPARKVAERSPVAKRKIAKQPKRQVARRNVVVHAPSLTPPAAPHLAHAATAVGLPGRATGTTRAAALVRAQPSKQTTSSMTSSVKRPSVAAAAPLPAPKRVPDR